MCIIKTDLDSCVSSPSKPPPVITSNSFRGRLQEDWWGPGCWGMALIIRFMIVTLNITPAPGSSLYIFHLFLLLSKHGPLCDDYLDVEGEDEDER